jgi:hypothetical protein
MATRQISPERKAIYYGGMAVAGLGLLLFLSTFVTFLLNFGNFNNFENRVMSEGLRAVGGMVLMVIGAGMINVGARGLAGSGVVLDPERARKDVEPWSRMAGGMADDVLSEVGVVKKLGEKLEPTEAKVKVRCRKCQALNDEVAKFCNQCGSAV